MPTARDAGPEVQRLLGLTEDELEIELGRRLTSASQGSDDAEASPQPRAVGFGAGHDFLFSETARTRNAGKRFLDRVSSDLYALIFDGEDADNARIRAAVAHGTEALSYAIGGVLMARFGWVPGTASVIAVILAKRIAVAGYLTLWETWKTRAR